tara:strand:- start:2286 stop:3305 length:1020 start_codon:yes stop_codon:yes gene_type:complete
MAIQYLYDDVPVPEDKPLFCTDTHRSKYFDCDTFDGSSFMFEHIKWDEKRARESLPQILISKSFAAKSSNPSNTLFALGKYALTPAKVARSLLASRLRTINSLKNSNRFLTVERQFPFVNSFNRAAVQQSQVDFLQQVITQAGGVGELFPIISIDEIEESHENYNRLLLYNTKTKGRFTQEEFQFLTSYGEAFFKSLYKEYILADLAVLEKVEDLIPHSLSDSLAEIMAIRSFLVTRALSGQFVTEVYQKDDQSYNLKLPLFVFSSENRIRAASLLKEKSEDPFWGRRLQKNMAERFLEETNTVLGFDIRETDPLDFPPKIAYWIIEAKEVLKAFDVKM